MLRKSLAATAFFALVALPAQGQEAELQWSWDRPDARPSSAVTAERILGAGQVELRYRFGQMQYGDVRFGTEILDFLDVTDVYLGAPLSRTNNAHMFTLGYGLTDWITLQGTVGWLDRTRDFAGEVGPDLVVVSNNSSGLSDVEAAALVEIYDRKGVQAHLIGAVEIPLGSIEKVGPDLAGTNRLLPYTMQLGTGSFSAVPGAVAMIQNEHATLGAQVKARFRLYDNSRDYRVGDEFEGNLWANYMLNDNFAITTGARFLSFGGIQGQDSGMNPLADPEQDALFSGGTRLDIPVGINIRMTEGLLAGTDFNFEFVWPTYENYDAFRQQGDWGFNFGVFRDVTGLKIPFIN